MYAARGEIYDGTFNISTLSSIIIASSGIAVAKHGGRKSTSNCGSIDILEYLGLPLAISSMQATKLLSKHSIAFLFAPIFHPLLSKVAPLRQAIASRTIFNLLGPILNPANVKRQVIGIFDPSLRELVARVLHKLGSKEAMIVHSEDGLDEISISAPTHITHLKNGIIHNYQVAPEEVGLPRAEIDKVTSTSSSSTADIFKHVLNGKPGPCRDIVLLNAAAGFIVAGKAQGFTEAVLMAAKQIDSGRAKQLFNNLICEKIS
jgi:anthranilate phosphoribosyltransferase